MTKPRFQSFPGQNLAFGASPTLVYLEVTRDGDRDWNTAECQRSTHAQQLSRVELTTPQALRLIDQLTQFPLPPQLVLTGNNPFKRADILEIVEYAAKRHLDVAMALTPTSLVTPKALRRLRCAGISRVAINVEGADARTHDAACGIAGSFYQSLQTLADVRAEGIPSQVNTTIVPANVGQIDRMAELFSRAQIDTWSAFFLVPVCSEPCAPCLSAAQTEIAMDRLCHQSQRRPYRIKTAEAPQYRRFLIQRCESNGETGRATSSYVPLGVNDGKRTMFVSHVGLVHPSGHMPILCGIYPLQNVVRIYQDSPVFRKLRDANCLEGKCGRCEFRHVCGGSRARAYAATDNPFAEDPACAYEPAGGAAA
jgi:radical SAM protein with 4Fe4S-binding SPASM domain